MIPKPNESVNLLSQLQTIGIVTHSERPHSQELGRAMLGFLQSHNLQTWLTDDWTPQTHSLLLEHPDMVVAIGGDGAILRAVRACAPHGVPVLGVNMGYLGFLTAIADPQTWQENFIALLEGHYWIEERMMMYAQVLRDGTSISSHQALNDVVISRDAAGTILLQLYIDGDWATTYHADALIVASATGSTAYALAAGGPILPPELRNFLIVPVAPHLSMDRPIVLSEGASVQVVVSAERPRESVLRLDGTAIMNLKPNDCVVIQASEISGRFIRLGQRNYFYRSILDRLEPRIHNHNIPAKLKFN